MATLLYGFSDILVKELISQGLDVTVWIRPGGEDHTDQKIYDKISKNISLIIKGRQFIAQSYQGEAHDLIPTDLYNDLKRIAFFPFIRCHARRFQCKSLRKDFVEHEHAFFLFSLRCYNLLRTYSIDRVLLWQTPHKGADVVLYYLAEIMGLEIVLLSYNPALDKLCYEISSGISDIGLNTHAPKHDPLPVEVSHPARRPFYVDRFKKKYFSAIKKLSYDVIKYMWVTIRMRPRSSRDIHKNRSCFSWRRLLFLLRKPKQATPKSCLKDIIKGEYVYVPLHLEPEAVIDVKGGDWREQLLFILQLRRRLPQHVSIIVKENPAQTTYARDEYFYEAISFLPKVYYIYEDVDTFGLMQDALAVATVLGTAGWEALRFGKPVIIGGHIWYRTLPGVFQVDDFDYDRLKSFEFDQETLRKSIKQLSRKLRKGLPSDLPNVKSYLVDFDIEDNAKRIAKDVMEYIKQFQERTK